MKTSLTYGMVRALAAASIIECLDVDAARMIEPKSTLLVPFLV